MEPIRCFLQRFGTPALRNLRIYIFWIEIGQLPPKCPYLLPYQMVSFGLYWPTFTVKLHKTVCDAVERVLNITTEGAQCYRSLKTPRISQTQRPCVFVIFFTLRYILRGPRKNMKILPNSKERKIQRGL